MPVPDYREHNWLERLTRLEAEFHSFRDECRRIFVKQDQHMSDLNHIKKDADAILTKDRDNYVRKDVYDEIHGALVSRVAGMEAWQNRLVIGIVLTMVAGLVAVVDKLFFR